MESSRSIEPPIHVRLAQGFKNRLQNGVRSEKNVVVPEPQHAKAVRSEKGITSYIIIRLVDVLTPVKLDNDVGFKASEIADVVPHRMLPTELETIDLPSPQATPKQSLGLRGVLTKITCKAKHPRIES
jgi:hypothetical protein